MFRIDAPGGSPDAGDRPTRLAAPALPWCWPTGARVLLAILAIASAFGLAAGRRDLSRGAGPGIASIDLALDPDTARPEDLAALPQIGPTLARRIVEARADGPFRTKEDLRARVRGIGPMTLARIEPYLRFDEEPGAKPSPGPAGTMLADAGAPPGPAPTARRPTRSRARKSKGPPVQLAAKAGAPIPGGGATP